MTISILDITLGSFVTAIIRHGGLTFTVSGIVERILRDEISGVTGVRLVGSHVVPWNEFEVATVTVAAGEIISAEKV